MLIATSVHADPLADFKSGHEKLAEQQLSEALYYLTCAVADPTFSLKDYAQYEIGETYLKNGNYLLAAGEYGKVSKDSAVYPWALLKCAEGCAKEGALKGAAQAYREYFTDFSGEEKAPQAGLQLARIYEQQGEFKEAYRVYNQVDLYYPLTPAARTARLALKKLVKRHKLPAYKTKPQDLFKKGMAYLKESNYDEAEAVFFRLARDFPKSKYAGEAFLMMGRAELWGGKLTEAISNIERSLGYASERKKGRNLYYLGRAYGRRGKYEYAMTYMKKVLDKYPQSSYADDACYYLGVYFEYADSSQAAIATYLYLADKYPRSAYVDDALFRAGMLLYKSYDFENAYRVFAYSYVKAAGDETPKCLLWWGKLAERLGKKDEAAGVYYYLADRFDHTYAAYRAREKLLRLGYQLPANNKMKKDNSTQALSVITGTEDDDKQELENLMGDWQENHGAVKGKAEAQLERYRLLTELGLTEYAVLEAKRILSAENNGDRALSQITMGQILQKVGEYRTPIRLTEEKVKSAVLAGKPESLPLPVWRLAYPKGFFNEVSRYSQQNRLDPYLTLAVIREESRFNPKALSRSKAHGLMQIIPSTGRLLARELKIKPFYRGKMYQVETNLQMGTYYLSNLISSFDGNIALALAGYNGGPARVKKWVKSWYNGDMRNLDIDEFVEYIPLRETRYYVQKVLHSYYEYKRIYE